MSVEKHNNKATLKELERNSSCTLWIQKKKTEHVILCTPYATLPRCTVQSWSANGLSITPTRHDNTVYTNKHNPKTPLCLLCTSNKYYTLTNATRSIFATPLN